MWRDIIQLISVTSTVNDMGDVIETETTRDVFVNKRSVGQKEFYEAMQAGLKPELTFELRSLEYQDEEKLSHNGKQYKIIRTYDKGEFLELICSGLVGD